MKFHHEAPHVAEHPHGRRNETLVKNVFSDDWFAAKCFNLWEAHLEWLHKLGFADALRQQELTAEDFGGPTGHEVVDLLSDFIFQTGYVNAHLGLTSSDIVDNVRLMQVNESLVVLGQSLESFLHEFVGKFRGLEADTVGFTHWQPAAPLTWQHRVMAWTDPLRWLANTRPCIFAKKFGGPVGNASSLHLIIASSQPHRDGKPLAWLEALSNNPFPWTELFDLAQPNNAHPLQSSDHMCELDAINWCARVAAQLHKIALDLRVLASHGLVVIGRPPGHAGSSSMPHKTNPHKWEKVCSIARVIAGTQREMWDVAAQNSLERTLDTSWQLKSLLARCFTSLALALDEMAGVNFRVDETRNAELLRQLRPLISSDHDLTRRVLSGKSRWEAYNEALSIINNDSK